MKMRYRRKRTGLRVNFQSVLPELVVVILDEAVFWASFYLFLIKNSLDLLSKIILISLSVFH